MPIKAPNDSSPWLDSSAALFSLYSEIATTEDIKAIDHWQREADSTLVFTALFSASVAGLLGRSIQDLRPNSQDTSAFYLANIYQLFADTNVTVPRTSIPSTPPPFSPQRYAVWVNSLWFMSLVISLTCALLATSLQQWTRRYTMNTQSKLSSPQEQARKCAFFTDGLDEGPIPLPWAVQGMPALLHISVLLFFAGLVVFLFNINITVAIPLASWIAFSFLAYVCITLMPIVWPDSPYHTPFSSLVGFVYAFLAHSCFQYLVSIAIRTRRYDSYLIFRELERRYRRRISGGHMGVVQEEILYLSAKIDLRILAKTLHALSGDDSMERFFQSIPGFLGSDLVQVHNIRKHLPFRLARLLMGILHGFLDRTLASQFIPEETKNRRLKICEDVMNLIPGPTVPLKFLDDTAGWRPIKASQTIETAQTLAASWSENTDQEMSLCTRHRIVEIFSGVGMQERNDRWERLVAQQFSSSGLDRDAFHHHFNSPNNDDVFLYMLNLIILEATVTNSLPASSATTLSTLSDLVTPGIDSNLRNEFCRLWNSNIAEARGLWASQTSIEILRRGHRVFFALHQGTGVEPTPSTADTHDDDPQTFRVSLYGHCTFPDHVDVTPSVVPVPPSLPFPSNPV